MRLFINAGHSIEKAWDKEPKEDRMNVRLRDVLAGTLRSRGFDVLEVPDNLEIRDSINWVNRQANIKNDIAISIHFNSHSNPRAHGTEVFYYAKENTKEKASILSKCVSKALGTRNRGAKPDTKALPGLLGWLRLTYCASFLIEVCFLTSSEDMSKYDPELAVQGIFNGIQAISNTDEEVARIRRQYVGILKRIEELLRLILALLKGKI